MQQSRDVHKLANAALWHFKAEKQRAETNLSIYLSNPVGIGEHPDVVAEVIKLVKTITEAEEAIKYLEEI
jgi:hypothetical protein